MRSRMNAFLWAAFHPGAPLLLDGRHTKVMPWMQSNQPSIPLRGVFVLGYQSSAVMVNCYVDIYEAAPSIALCFLRCRGALIDLFVVITQSIHYPWLPYSYTVECFNGIHSSWENIVVSSCSWKNLEGGMDIFSRCHSIDASICCRKYKQGKSVWISLMWKREKATTEKNFCNVNEKRRFQEN